jgi:protein TonB
VNTQFDEPTIPPRLQRPLAAVWISLGLHVAVIALIQVAPPAAMSLGEPVSDARRVSPPAAPPAVKTPDAPPEKVPLLAPSETVEALPVAKPVQPPVPTETTVAASQPAEPVPASAESQPAPVLAPQGDTRPTPELTMTSSVDLTYYGARDLDVQPHALHKIEPDYPAEADRQRLSGKVRLQLKLEADGRISDLEVISATPPGLFEDSAIKAFRDARFAPAQKNGHPVRALVQIEVLYDWEGQPR